MRQIVIFPFISRGNCMITYHVMITTEFDDSTFYIDLHNQFNIQHSSRAPH
jgi:hypothetical protein